MRSLFALAMTGAVLLACSDGDDGDAGGGGGCANITGNYDVTVTKVGGSCPSTNDGTTKASITIAEEDSELYVVLPGVGGGCKGALDSTSCRFQAQCEVFQGGARVVTYNVDYTFSGKTFSGSLVGAAEAGVLSPEPCDSQARHVGTRL